jgi:hypothetical protein
METKVTGSEPMACNPKTGQGSSWTLVPTEEKKEHYSKERHKPNCARYKQLVSPYE